jgi:hypothetical protein
MVMLTSVYHSQKNMENKCVGVSKKIQIIVNKYQKGAEIFIIRYSKSRRDVLLTEGSIHIWVLIVASKDMSDESRNLKYLNQNRIAQMPCHDAPFCISPVNDDTDV